MRKLLTNTSLTLVVFTAIVHLPTVVMSHPGSGIEVDKLGQIFFLDTGSGLWKLDTLGNPTHLSPLLYHWLALDAKNQYSSTRLSSSSGDISKASKVPTALLSSDYPIAVGQDGNFYYAPSSTSDLRLIRVVPSGESRVIATLPTTPSGERHQYLNGLAAGPDSSLYYTDHNTVRRLSKDGRVSTIATVTRSASNPSIPGVGQRPYLRDLDVDSKGVIYVADNGDARVLKITPDGKITTLVQTQSPWAPTAVAVFKDAVYSLEFSHTASDNRVEWMPRIRKITPDGKSEIILTVEQMPGAR
jgi:hypothetical protein